MRPNPSNTQSLHFILRLIGLGCLGAGFGYWVLPLIVPYSLSHKVEWIVSPLVLTGVGTALGIVFGIRLDWITAFVYLGGFAGATVGRLIPPITSSVAAYLWYELLQFRWPLDTFVFMDIVDILTWVLLSLMGAFVSWFVARHFLHRHS